MKDESVVELLRRSHRRHLGLVESVRARGRLAERAVGGARIAAELRCQTRAERDGLLRELQKDDRFRAVAERALLEHGRLDRLVADVACRAYDARALDEALEAYRAAFAQYARFAEDELFPSALEALGAERCSTLATRYLACIAG